MQPTAQQILDAVAAHNYALAVVLVLIAAVSLVRWLAPKVHGPLGSWLNSDRGGSALVLVGGVLGSVATALIAGKQVNPQLLLGGLMTAAAASGGWNMVWDLLSPSDKKASTKLADTVAAPPEPPKAAMLLPFIAAAALFATGCQTLGGQALKNCEMGQLPKIYQTGISDVSLVLANPAENWKDALTDLGAKLGGGQIDCVVQAITASAKAKIAPHAAPSPALMQIIQRGQEWGSTHKTSCAPSTQSVM